MTDTNRYVVRLEDRADEKVSADDAHTIYGREHHHTTTLHDGDGSFVYCELTSKEVQQLEQSSCVKEVAPDKKASTCLANENEGKEKNASAQTESTPWGVTKVNADALHEQGVRGDGVSVGVVDSGIAANHTDLNVSGGQTWEESQVAPPPWDDDNNHGTHCAGIVSAESNDIGVLGVAPDADVYAYKVLGTNGYGTYADISAGIVQAVDDGRDIISCSIGGTSPYSALRDAVQYAKQEGVPTIVSAGNESCTDCVKYPAAYSDATAVSATDDSDDVASFVSKGLEIDIAAPGVDVPSTIPGGYSNYDGTSMAAPHVSGGIALLSSMDGLSPLQGLALLFSTAVDIGHPDTAQGFGLMDVQAAYEKHKSTTMDYPHELRFNGRDKNSDDTTYYTFLLNDGGGWERTDSLNDNTDLNNDGRAGGEVQQGLDVWKFGPENATFDPNGCNVDGPTDGLSITIDGTDYGPNGRDISDFNNEPTVTPTDPPSEGMSDETIDVDETGYNVIDGRPRHTTRDIRLFVDPNGSDSNEGTRQNPLGTLQEAADRVPHLLQHNVKIVLRDGVHENDNFFTGTHVCNYVGDDGGYEIISDSGDKNNCEVHLSNGHFSIGTVGGDPLNAVKITDIDFYCQLQCYDTAFIDGCTLRGPTNPSSERGSRCLGGYDNMVRVQFTEFTDQTYGIAVKDGGEYHCISCDFNVDESAMRSYGCGGDPRFKNCTMNTNDGVGDGGLSDVRVK